MLEAYVPRISKTSYLCPDYDAGTIMTISKDRVKPSPLPDSWKLDEIFATGVVYGTYMAVMTVVFFWAVEDTDFFTVRTGCLSSQSCNSSNHENNKPN
jgi:hypothetical protein